MRAVTTQARAGQGHVLWLHGEAGIGKSRLAAEAGLVARAFGFTAYGGSARSHGTRTSYLIWQTIWRDLLDARSRRFRSRSSGPR